MFKALFKEFFYQILVMFVHLWTAVQSIWKSSSKIPKCPELVLRFIFCNKRLEILEFLSDVYSHKGLFLYEKKVYIVDPKLSMKAINKLDKGSHDYLKNSPLHTSFLGDSERSLRIRRILASIFRKSVMEQKGTLMSQVVEKTVQKMKESDVCNFSDLTLKMALDIVGRVLLGIDLKALDGLQDNLLDAMMTILHETFALGKINPSSDEFIAATEKMHHLTMELLSRTLNESDDQTTMAHQLHKAGGMDVAKSNLQLFMMAGSETTASSLPVMMDFLAKRPDIQRELQHEADEWIESLRNNVSRVPPKLESATKELLRIYAIAPFVSRTTDVDVDLGEVLIPAGSDLRIFIWGIHRSSHLWEDSKQYQSDRFLEAFSAKSQATFWMPFGAGPRVCIGQHLAWFEMRLALTYFLHNFTVYPISATREMEFCVDWEHAVVHPVSDVILGLKLR